MLSTGVAAYHPELGYQPELNSRPVMMAMELDFDPFWTVFEPFRMVSEFSDESLLNFQKNSSSFEGRPQTFFTSIFDRLANFFCTSSFDFQLGRWPIYSFFTSSFDRIGSARLGSDFCKITRSANARFLYATKWLRTKFSTSRACE